MKSLKVYSEYNQPVIFRELEDGTEFTLLLHNIVFIKVPPQEFVQLGGSKIRANAIDESKTLGTWVMDVEMAFIKEQTA